jgi:hypothetical protein
MEVVVLRSAVFDRERAARAERRVPVGQPRR